MYVFYADYIGVQWYNSSYWKERKCLLRSMYHYVNIYAKKINLTFPIIDKKIILKYIEFGSFLNSYITLKNWKEFGRNNYFLFISFIFFFYWDEMWKLKNHWIYFKYSKKAYRIKLQLIERINFRHRTTYLVLPKL